MGERVMRGSRLGAVSYENDRNIDLAPRQAATYVCPEGHRFELPFAVEAEIPLVWECKVCRAPGALVDGSVPEPKKGKPPRTHWDMLLERRSITELEELLHERLGWSVKVAARAPDRCSAHYPARPIWPGRSRSPGSSDTTSPSMTSPTSLRPRRVRTATTPYPATDVGRKHPSGQPAGDGQDQQQPGRVGDEARNEQQDPAHQHHRAVEHVEWRLTGRSRGLQRCPRSRPSAADHRATEDAGAEQQEHGRDSADRRPHLDDHEDLDDRQHQQGEQREATH